MILLYAIAEPVPLPEADEPLRAIEHDAVAAIYAERAEAPTPTADALWRHERVLELLMAGGALLPMRFGSTLEGERELRELLRARASEFAERLDFVRGRVEMGVRAPLEIESSHTPAQPGSGREYLAAKLARRSAAVARAAELDAQLEPLACASTFRAVESPLPELAGSYLVERVASAEFARRAARLGVACTGPWPPFSFADGARS